MIPNALFIYSRKLFFFILKSSKPMFERKNVPETLRHPKDIICKMHFPVEL